MADTFAKKEKEKKRAIKKKDKAEKRLERKTNNDKGKSLEDMIVYLDEYGNITDIPPEKQKRKKINAEDMQIGATPRTAEDTHLEGRLSLFFQDKGYGFITEDNTKVNIFVHSNNIEEPIALQDRVSFQKEKTQKGFNAINVRKIK